MSATCTNCPCTRRMSWHQNSKESTFLRNTSKIICYIHVSKLKKLSFYLIVLLTRCFSRQFQRNTNRSFQARTRARFVVVRSSHRRTRRNTCLFTLEKSRTSVQFVAGSSRRVPTWEFILLRTTNLDHEMCRVHVICWQSWNIWLHICFGWGFRWNLQNIIFISVLYLVLRE